MIGAALHVSRHVYLFVEERQMSFHTGKGTCSCCSGAFLCSFPSKLRCAGGIAQVLRDLEQVLGGKSRTSSPEGLPSAAERHNLLNPGVIHRSFTRHAHFRPCVGRDP